MAGKIDEKEVRRIAHLARLKLTDDEVAAFRRQLEDILAYVEKLNEADTENVEPTAHALPIRNVFRDDEPATPMSVDAVLANAPDKAPPFFKVPKILDQDSA